MKSARARWKAEASTRWLRRAQPDVGEALSGLQAIRDQGIRATGIIKVLRALAKQAPPVHEAIDPDEAIRSVLRLIATEIDAQGVHIDMHLQASESRIIADRVQIQQVILNLVSNALDASAEVPASRHRLVICTRQKREEVLISVQDFGPGIDAGSVERIFDPLFSTKETGMGMGLAICKSIVEAHAGSLEVASVIGEGSTFTLRLPLNPAAKGIA